MRLNNNFFKKFGLGQKDYKGYETVLPFLFELTKNNSFILSFWIHGSRVDKKYDERSDLDIGYIVEKEKNKETLKEKLRGVFYYKGYYDYFFNRIFEYWEFNGKVIGFDIYSKKEFHLRVDNFFKSVELLDTNQDFVEHVVLQSKIIYDPKGLFSDHKEKLSKCPFGLKREAIELYLKRIKQEAEWWSMRKKWKSVFEEISVLKPFIDEVAKCHHLLNDRFCMRSLKQYAIDIDELKPNIKKEVFLLANIRTDNPNHPLKMIAMNTIFKRLEKKYQEKFNTNQFINL